MAANYLPTVRAFPFFLLPVEELFAAFLLDKLEVIDHAHVEKGSVPRI